MARGSNDKSENYPGIGRHNVLIVCTLHGGACAHRVLTTWLRRLFIRITSRYMSYIIQGLRSRAAGRRPLRVRKEEWTFSRKAETKHKWRNRRLENAKRSIYSTTVQDRDDYDYDFVIIIHSPSP